MEVPASKFDHRTFSWLWQNDANYKKIQPHGRNLVFKGKPEIGVPLELPLGAPYPQIWVTPKHPFNILVE